jgi:DNA repair exonuclease SbcCD ATPase subunit
MALESPFSIMQLEKATKQIAAFGVEADKLKPSIKMLADISAGLGVDIDRLILVYGHIKANNALQQLHVRQFTNAGFNIAGELAKYYTEMEGKLVSVAEVTDRIHKKLVSFADVEEVLKRVTSAGGMFYDMQKKQSDSLWGQMQRIKDQYDLMMNEIGQSNQSAISFALTTIRSLIKEWRDLAPVITAAAAAFGSYLVVGKMLPMIIGYLKSVVVSYKSLTAAAMGATAAQEGLNAAQKANAVGLIVSAVTMLVTYLWQAAHATDALADELNRIYTEGTTTMWNLAHNFEELAQQATSHTNTYEDRKKALDDINRIYGDILPKEAIQIENLEKSRDKWGELTEAVKTYELERMKQLAQQSINAELQKQMEEIKVDLMATAGDFIKFNKSIKDTEKGVKTTINTIFTGIEAEILSGSLKAEDATAAFIQRMKKYYNLSDEVQLVMPNVTEWRSAFGDTLAAMGQTLAVWQDDYGKKFKKSWQKMWYDVRNSSTWGATTFDIVSINTMDKLNQVADLYSDMEERYGMFNDALANADTYTARQLAQNSQKYVNAFKDRMSVVDNYMKVVEGFQDTDRVAALTNGDGSLTELGKALESVNEILKRLGKAPLTIESINEALASNIGLQQHFQDVSTEVLGGFLAWLKTTNDYAQNDYLQGWAKRAQKQVSELGGTEIQRNVQAVMNQIASSLGVSLEIFDEVKVTGQDTFDTIRKSVQGLITKYQELGKEWDKIAGTMVLADPTAQAEKVTGMTKEQRENLETFIKALQMLFSGLGGLDKESNKSGKDEVLEMWKKRIKYIEDFFKQYKEGLKNFSKESVDEQVTKNFSQLFSQTGIDKLQGLNIADLIAGNVDDKGLVAAFERLKALIPAQYKDLMDEVQKKISDTSMSIDVEVQKQGVEDFKKELQDMFDNYELSKTFKDLGIDINFTTMVGGTPTTLEDLKSSIDDTWKQVLVNQKLYGSEGEKAWKDYQKKLTDIENKEQQERIKNYAKYLTQAYGERASYELDALADIQKMRTDILKIKDEAQKKISSADTTEEEKERLSKIIKQWDNELAQGISNMKEEMEKKLTEFDFKALTESPLFSEMFQDLSSLSNKVLDQMIVKIKEIRENTSNLSLTQIRTLAQYEEKLANAKFDASAFKAPIEAIQKAYKLRAEGITAQSASDDLAAAQQKLDLYQQELNDLQLVQGILDGNRNINKEDLVLTENQNKLLKMEPSLISAKLAATKANVKASEGEVSDLIQYVNTYKQAQSATQKLSATLQEVGKVGGEAIDAITSGIKLFGGEVDDSTQIWLDFAKQVIDQCVTLGIAFVALGIEINEALGIIGLIASALSVVVGLFTALLGAHDAKLSKQIKKLENNVKDLEAAFDKLEKARDKALTVESYDTDYEAMEANLKKQIQDYQQMIELESRKKDADEDTLRDYRDTISDLQDQLEELKETRITDLGGFGESNYRDVAEDFVDAWLDAFKEAGDGLDALDDKWQEYMENLFLKQAAMKKAGTLYSKAMSIIDNAIDSGQSGFELEQAVQLARQAADDASTELNEYLKALAGVFGISQEGENTLSELQQGISNITESQAAAIEAYLNSIRFFVASQDTRLANIYTIIYDQYVGSSNPLVSVVTEIRDALNQFASRFASAFVNSGGKWKLQVC